MEKTAVKFMNRISPAAKANGHGEGPRPGAEDEQRATGPAAPVQALAVGARVACAEGPDH
jgi:hypothetical protein